MRRFFGLVLVICVLCNLAFAGIVAKVKKVERDRGNLNVTVGFYYNGKELEGEDEQYLIPENGLEKAKLKEYVRRKIQELKQKLSPKPIKAGEVILKTD